MILILIAIVVAAAISICLLLYSADGWDGTHLIACLVGLVLAFGAGVSAVSYAFAGWAWFAADSKAKIINREYGTSYTQAEVFWAADVIDTIREIDRKRFEVNGDLMRDANGDAKPAHD